MSTKIGKSCSYCGVGFLKKPNSRQIYCSLSCNFKNIGWTEEKETGCFIWNGTFRSDGYSTFRSRGAYRFACEMKHGPAPKNKNLAMHSCDNIRCVNPDHLSWGSHLDNSNDKIKKNRHLYGEKSKKSKLTDSQVREIKIIIHNKTYGNLKEIATFYKVAEETISSIKNNRNWKHIIIT